MRKFGSLSRVCAAVFCVSAGMAQAHPHSQGLAPAELPGAGYASNSYVDSRGCVYVRTQYEGKATWLPRVDAAGVPLCGQDAAGAPIGVTETTRLQPSSSAPVAAAAPMKTSAYGNLYVQVGGYAEPANVARASARVAGMGYPVHRVVSTLKGRKVTTILAGPFNTQTELASALRKLRAAGYSDAFTRP